MARFHLFHIGEVGSRGDPGKGYCYLWDRNRSTPRDQPPGHPSGKLRKSLPFALNPRFVREVPVEKLSASPHEGVKMPELDRTDITSTVDRIAHDVRGQGIEGAYSALDHALLQFESAGYRVADLLPTATVEGLGLARKNAPRPDGRTFWQHYAETVCVELCQDRTQLNNLVKTAVGGGSGSLVTTIMVSLSLPQSAVLIAAAIAGILVAMGVDAFCKYRGFHSAPKRRR